MKDGGFLSPANKHWVVCMPDRLEWSSNGTVRGSIPLNTGTLCQVESGNGSKGKLRVGNGPTSAVFYSEPGPDHLQQNLGLWASTIQEQSRQPRLGAATATPAGGYVSSLSDGVTVHPPVVTVAGTAVHAQPYPAYPTGPSVEMK